MDKNYKQFYEIGNSRYFTLVALDELYLASESFIRTKNLFRSKKVSQGLKLLKINAPISIFFQAVKNCEEKKIQKYEKESGLIQYENLDNKGIANEIVRFYQSGFDIEEKNIKMMYDYGVNQTIKDDENGEIDKDLIEKRKDILRYDRDMRTKQLESTKERVLESFKDVKKNAPKLVKALMDENKYHLFTDTVTSFMKDYYLYEMDEFGGVTIYIVTALKGIVKRVDTFIYDKKLIENFLKSEYEKEK